MERLYKAVFCLPVVAIHCSVHAQQGDRPVEIQRVEIKGPGAVEQRRNDAVGRIVVGRDDLDRFGDTTLSGVLKRQPGLSVSGNEVRMRGLGAGYTQILINGQPAPGNFSIDSIPPDLIERIEILRSAAADTMSQSIAGSVNIVLRKKVSGPPRRTAKVSVEHLQERSNPAGTVQWSGRRDKTSYSVVATVSRSQVHNEPYADERSVDADGLALRRFYQPVDIDQRRASLTPRVDTTLANGDKLSWQGIFNNTRTYAAGESRETTFVGDPTASPEAHWRNVFKAWLAKSDLSWDHRFANAGRLTLTAGVDVSDRDGGFQYHGIDSDGIPWLDRVVVEGFRERRATTTGKYLAPLVANHDMAFGWDAAVTRRSESRLQQDSEPQTPPYYTLDQGYTATVGRLALYAQDEWTLGERLQAYLGLRWEGLNTHTTGTEFAGTSTQSRVLSPIAQVVWKLPGRERDQLRAALSRTYKAPQPIDLVPRRYPTNNDNGATNPDMQGNPGLRPELAWGLDVAYESYFSRDGVVSISGYARRIHDVVLRELWVENGKWISAPINDGQAEVRGIEFDARVPVAAPRPGWPGTDVHVNFGRNWSRVDNLQGPDNRLAAQAPVTANVGADLNFKAGITAGVNLHVVGGNVARLTSALTTRTAILRELDTYVAWPAWGGQWRFSASDLLHQTRRDVQIYDDGGTVNERRTYMPRQAVVRLQYEAPF
ncbi:TonB-dependent siderophore receptor [Massilia sp. Root335]|uniref:TonB-dependent receptor plug domain-containing protein n=1 Tax=Massilia sp. Root335 TaxID=1736517 RepID=UPI0009E9B915|nr:TonB-dependent receptor [Massilia sp. Root335]